MNRGTKIVALTSLWTIPALIFFLASHYGWHSVWRSLGVNPVGPPFLDLRSIAAGVQTLQHGGNPLMINTFEALQRPLNYPKIWLYIFSFLGIEDQNVTMVALLFCALYLLCISKLIFQAKSSLECLAVLFAGLSVAPLIGFERGNIDLVVFAIVFLGCVLPGEALRVWMFVIAAVLKLFPMAVLAAEVVRRYGKKRILPVVLLVLVAALFVAQWHDLVLINRGTPRSAFASYGVISLRECLRMFLLEDMLSTQNGLPVARAAIVACVIAAQASVILCWGAGLLLTVRLWKKPLAFDRQLLQSKSGALFFLFGTVYVSTFAIGSNWDYRLIFLLPTLPFAFELSRNPIHFRWGVAYILCLLLAENCISWVHGYKSLLAQAFTVALFFLALRILAAQAKSYLTGERMPVRAAPRDLAEVEALVI